MSKVMFRGREVIAVQDFDCKRCVGTNDETACNELPGCGGNTHFEYAKMKPFIDVFIETGAKEYYYFTACLHCVDCVSYRYSTRRAAILGAKRFCYKIGFTCRIKGDK